jgi:hypothetical protein
LHPVELTLKGVDTLGRRLLRGEVSRKEWGESAGREGEKTERSEHGR